MFYFDENKSDSVCGVGFAKEDEDEIIYLHKGQADKKTKYNFSYKDYDKEISKNGIKGRQKQYILNKLEKAYFENAGDDALLLEDEGFRKLYRYVQQEEEKKSKYVFDSKIIPMLREKYFNVAYFNGPSGGGKTKLAVKVIQEYLSKHKKSEVFLISKKEKDVTIDQIKKLKRLDVKTFVEDPISIDEFPDGSVIVFDDFEGYESDKALYKQIIGFMNDCLTMGRTKLLQIIIITHSSALGRASSLIFQEASLIVLYPLSMSHHSMKYILGEKVGLDTQQIKYIKNLKSKWIAINKKYPRFLISGREIELM